MSMEKTEILPLVSIQDFRIVEMESNKVLFDAYLDIWHKFDSLSPLFPMSQKKSQKTHKHLKIVEYFCETWATENWRNLNYNNKNETLIHSISKWCVYVCEIVFESNHFSFTFSSPRNDFSYFLQSIFVLQSLKPRDDEFLRFYHRFDLIWCRSYFFCLKNNLFWYFSFFVTLREKYWF